MDILKPCPFCESSKINHRYIRYGRQIFCQDCGGSAKPAFQGPKDDTIARVAAALNCRAPTKDGQMRTGDHVYHAPSGEEWVVAWADHADGYMAPCGWPTCQAKIADCTVIRVATDAESDALVEQLSKSGRTDATRAAAVREANMAVKSIVARATPSDASQANSKSGGPNG